jgi:hypothetical protein
MVMPTLPAFPAVEDLSERPHLLAGLTFVEGAATWDATDLARWFHTYAELLGCDGVPASVRSMVTVGPSVANPHPPPGPHPGPLRPMRPIALARWQVILAMRGLLSTPADDRFLNAAIFSGRVVRDRGVWRVETREGDTLSDVVLSLFAADILANREFHEQKLCVCDVCGRLSYHPALTTRAGCPDHVPGTDASEDDEWEVSGAG